MALYSEDKKDDLKQLFESNKNEIIEKYKEISLATFNNSGAPYFTILMNTKTGELFVVYKEHIKSTDKYIVVYRTIFNSLRSRVNLISEKIKIIQNSVEWDIVKKIILELSKREIELIFNTEVEGTSVYINKKGEIVKMNNRKRYDIIRHPKNVREMAYSLRELCDRYWERSLAEEEFEDFLNFYFKNHTRKIFDGEEFRKTIQSICGSERINLIGIYAKNFFEEW